MTNTLFYATLFAFFILCAIFVLLILIQKGRGGGISSAFGGAGGNTAFGSKTGDVLTWATSIVFAVFLLMCVALNFLATEVNASQTKDVNQQVAPPVQTSNPAIPTPDSAAVPATPDAATPDATAPGTATPSTQPGAN